MIQPIDRAFIEDALGRLSKLTPETKPSWGELTADELVPHLVGTVVFSLDRHPDPLQFQGNWFTRNVVWHIAMSGMVKIPKNIKFRDKNGGNKPVIRSDGDLETLRALLGEFMDGYERGDLKTAWHPSFGDVGPVGWARLHRMHTAHHLEQFGL